MLGNHPIGLYEKALDPSDDWKRRLEKAKKLGFDFMEICIDEDERRWGRLYEPPAAREALHVACREAGLPIRSMCLSVHRKFPFGSAEPTIRKKAGDLMLRAIDYAGEMGIRVIQLAGYDVYYEQSTPESRARFEGGLSWAAEQAAVGQVMLGMELMDTPPMPMKKTSWPLSRYFTK